MREIEFEVWAGDIDGNTCVTRTRTLPTEQAARDYLGKLDLSPGGREGMRIVVVLRRVIEP